MKLLVTLIFFVFSNLLIATEITKINFLIPGGPDGGWDSTARNIGKVLTKSKLIEEVSYINISGSGGGKAISYLIDNANNQKNTLMINSTPIVIRSLQKVFSHSFRDLTLIASIIADYQVLAVKSDSKLKNWDDILNKFKANPRKLKIGGGSTRGSMDHIVSAQIFKSAGYNPNQVKYKAYDAGGKALQGLLNEEIDVLSTGLGEVLDKHRKGIIKIIAVTSDTPLKNHKDIPIFKSLGVDVSFANWRGFFAAPGLDEQKIENLRSVLENMYNTKEWENVKKANEWVNLYKPTSEFRKFLENQEKSIDSLIKELGFL